MYSEMAATPKCMAIGDMTLHEGISVQCGANSEWIYGEDTVAGYVNCLPKHSLCCYPITSEETKRQLGTGYYLCFLQEKETQGLNRHVF